jgi:hypothetical protein
MQNIYIPVVVFTKYYKGDEIKEGEMNDRTHDTHKHVTLQ